MSSLLLFLAIPYCPYFQVGSLPTPFLREVITFRIRLLDSCNNKRLVFILNGITSTHAQKNHLNMAMTSFTSCYFTITRARMGRAVVAKYSAAWGPRGVFTPLVSQAEVLVATTVGSNNAHIDEKTAEQTEARPPFVFGIQQAHKSESASSALTLSTGSIYNMLILS